VRIVTPDRRLSIKGFGWDSGHHNGEKQKTQDDTRAFHVIIRLLRTKITPPIGFRQQS
jgi:hypothetical protein